MSTPTPNSIATYLDGQVRRHNASIDSTVAWFERELAGVLTKATAATITRLQADLEFDAEGRLLNTAKNVRTLLKLDVRFKEAMKAAGYGRLVEELHNGFGRQLPSFEEVLDVLQLPKPSWTKEDRAWFAQQTQASEDGLKQLVNQVGQLAKRKALVSIAGMRREQLVEVLAAEYGKTTAQAAAMADTSITVFYRTVSQRGFEKIDPEKKLKYRPYGPLDQLNRPFCRRLMSSQRAYTRAEIDAMANGQTPNVFLTFGGYRCRHQWAIDVAAAPDRSAHRTGAEIRQELEAIDQRFQRQLADLRTKRERLLAELRPKVSISDEDSLRYRQVESEIDRAKQSRLAELRKRLYAAQAGRIEMQTSRTAPPEVKRAAGEASVFLSSLLGHNAEGAVTIRLTAGGRASYSLSKKKIRASRSTPTDVLIHEAGHWIEDRDPVQLARSVEFLRRRTTENGQREPLLSLRSLTGQRGYRSHERARKDKFEDPYVGKDYSTGGRVYATEVLSMGLQYLFTDPHRLGKMDADYFDFLWESIGILRR